MKKKLVFLASLVAASAVFLLPSRAYPLSGENYIVWLASCPGGTVGFCIDGGMEECPEPTCTN